MEFLFKRRPTGSVRVGRVHGQGARDCQQDCFGVTDFPSAKKGMLAVVADGMGGLANSEQVSRRLVASLLEGYTPGGDLPPLRQLLMLLRQALLSVAELLREATAKSGSTLVACLLQDNTLSWVAVGDSRLYLWRDGGLIPLNRDHDLAHELTLMAVRGEIGFSEVNTNPRREALTSYVGRDFPAKIDYSPTPLTLLRGDKVVLMSDGVYRALSEAELAVLLAKSASVCEKTITARILEKNLPQQDNFTAVILEIQ